jgi:hypothetical protein
VEAQRARKRMARAPHFREWVQAVENAETLVVGRLEGLDPEDRFQALTIRNLGVALDELRSGPRSGLGTLVDVLASLGVAAPASEPPTGGLISMRRELASLEDG